MQISRLSIILVVVAMSSFLRSIASDTSGIAGKVVPIEGGTSPNGMFEVVNIYPKNEGQWHFEIRSKSGDTLISEMALDDLVMTDESGKYLFWPASTVLWRPNSRWVAISTRRSKFDMLTIVFRWDGHKFQRVPIPDYEGDTENTFRTPDHWLKNGGLVLDITLDHHTKSEPGGREYYATIGFSGKPPNGFKRSRTKTIIDE